MRAGCRELAVDPACQGGACGSWMPEANRPHLLGGLAHRAALERDQLVQVVQVCRAEEQRRQRHRALQRRAL